MAEKKGGRKRRQDNCFPWIEDFFVQLRRLMDEKGRKGKKKKKREKHNNGGGK